MPRIGDNGRPFCHENGSDRMFDRGQSPSGNAEEWVLGGQVGKFICSVENITGIVCSELLVLALANKPNLVISGEVVVEGIRRAEKQLIFIRRSAPKTNVALHELFVVGPNVIRGC